MRARSTSLIALVAAAAFACSAGCKRGSKRAERLVSERVPSTIAKLESAAQGKPVAEADVEFTAHEAILAHIWFFTATVKGSPDARPWRCFFDARNVGVEWCDKGEGKIFPQVVAHLRLGGNRGAIDDPAWVAFVRSAYDLRFVWPDKGFPYASQEERAKLRTPQVERPKDGGVTILLDAVDGDAVTTRFEAQVSVDDEVVVRRLPIQ